MHGWVGVEMVQVGLLLGIQGCESSIHLFLWLQWMPLGNGATGVGQHVGPVFQPSPCGLASYQDLPNGIILANLVVIQHCDHSQDFLGEQEERFTKSEVDCRNLMLLKDILIGYWCQKPGECLCFLQSMSNAQCIASYTPQKVIIYNVFGAKVHITSIL